MPRSTRPGERRGRARHAIGTAVRTLTSLTASVAIAFAASMPAAGAAATSPRDRLRSAAHGTLKGGFGTLQFHTDGTARFVVKECGYSPVRPGFVATFTDCPPDTATGKVIITDGGYQLRRPDGSAIRFTAYADNNNQLHLGYGAIGQVAADRTGTINLSPSERLVVSRTGCRYVQAGTPQVVPCQFIQDAGRTILTYPAPAGAAGASPLAGLVYLSGPRLLVSPDMIDRIYRR